MKRALAIAVVFMPGKRLAATVVLLRYAKWKHPLWFDGKMVMAEIMAHADEIAAQMKVQCA